MGANQTNGYDLTLEVGFKNINDILSATFDEEGLLCDGILKPIGFPSSCENFEIELSTDLLSSDSLPTDATGNCVKIKFTVGDSTFTLFVGIGLYTYIGGIEFIGLNFTDKLYQVDLEIPTGIAVLLGVARTLLEKDPENFSSLTGCIQKLSLILIGESALDTSALDTILQECTANIIASLEEALKNILEEKIGFLPLLPLPGYREGSDDALIISDVDFKTIDSGLDDVLLIALTMGGGTQGNLSAFVEPSDRGEALAKVIIGKPWLCRLLNDSLNLSFQLEDDKPLDAFQGCKLVKNINWKDGFLITKFTLDLGNEKFRMEGQMQKKITCGKAKVKFGGDIVLKVDRIVEESEHGYTDVIKKISFESIPDDPEIELDVSIWCRIAAVVLGSLFAIFGGPIGIFISTILVTLAFTLDFVLEKSISGILDKLTDTLDNLDQEFSLGGGIRIPKLENKVVNASIDDLEVGYDFLPKEYAIIKRQGRLSLKVDNYADLDQGMIFESPNDETDLALTTDSSGDLLIKSFGGRQMLPFPTQEFSRIRRFMFYRLPFLRISAQENPSLSTSTSYPHQTQRRFLWNWSNSIDAEDNRIFGMYTNSGNLAAIQIHRRNNDELTLLYRTYDLQAFAVQILGEFQCPKTFGLKRLHSNRILKPTSRRLATKKAGIPIAARRSRFQPGEVRRISREREISNVSELLHDNYGLGQWIVKEKNEEATLMNMAAKLRLTFNGFREFESIKWAINGKPLVGAEGSIDISGVLFTYEKEMTELILRSNSARSTVLNVACEVVDVNDKHGKTSRKLKYDNNCKIPEIELELIPTFEQYQEAFESFGVITPSPHVGRR